MPQRLAIWHLTCDNESGREVLSHLNPGLTPNREGLAMKATPKVCDVEDCTRVHRARGMCIFHYERWRKRNGSTMKKLKPGRPTRVYSPEIVEKVRALYGSGLNRAQVDALVPGVNVQKLMRKHGITPRDKRDYLSHSSGPESPSWLGDDATYWTFHRRVRTARGIPKECEWCGANDPSAGYHWANLTGNYNDVADFARLCVKCHGAYDAARRAETGRNTVVGTKWWRF